MDKTTHAHVNVKLEQGGQVTFMHCFFSLFSWTLTHFRHKYLT